MNFYETNFLLMENHNYSLEDLNNMVPWEREIYVAMLVNQMKQQRQQAQQMWDSNAKFKRSSSDY